MEQKYLETVDMYPYTLKDKTWMDNEQAKAWGRIDTHIEIDNDCGQRGKMLSAQDG